MSDTHSIFLPDYEPEDVDEENAISFHEEQLMYADDEAYDRYLNGQPLPDFRMVFTPTHDTYDNSDYFTDWYE